MKSILLTIIFIILLIFNYFNYIEFYSILNLAICIPFSVSEVMPKPIKIFNDLSDPKIITQIETELKNKSDIYGIFNKDTSQIYVGSAQDLVKRFKEHLKSDKTNVRLERSINKYGLSVFSFIVFEFYSNGKTVLHPLAKNKINESTLNLTDLETLYIQSFLMDSLFNFKFEATSMAGYKHTEEALAKIRFRMQRDKHPMFGITHSELAKTKISAAFKGENNHRYGVTLSEKTKALISASKSKGVIEVYDKNNDLVISFPNAVLTAEWVGIHKTTVGRYIKSGKLFNDKYYFKLTPKSIK